MQVSPEQSGVMILFSPRFDTKCIRWKEWLQGGVLEARAVLDGARIVIAAIYQHVWSAAKTLQANKDDRAQVLSALAKVVRQAPKRDSFVNTWQCAQAHTYEQGATATQIDYILTKEPSAGSKAKRSGPWGDCPLGSWKTGGHFPTLAEVPIIRHWMLQTRRGPRQKYDVAALQKSVRTHDSKAQEMQQRVEDRMQSCSEPSAWNALLI